MVKYLHQRCAERKWLQEFGDDTGVAPEQSALGVAIKLPGAESYATEPLTVDAQFVEVLRLVNGKVGFTMSSEITESICPQVSPFQSHLQLGPRVQIPVIQSLEQVLSGEAELDPKAFACLLREERIVMLWSDTVEGIIAHAADVEDRLMETVSVLSFLLSNALRLCG